MILIPRPLPLLYTLCSLSLLPPLSGGSETAPYEPGQSVRQFEAKETLTVLEADSGDTILFTLRNGRTVKLELLETRSEVAFTTLAELKNPSPKERSIYKMTCRLRLDGQEMEMVRYNPVQQAFYEPYTINGLNIWFDGLRSLGDFFLETHGACLPTREARFALQDATLSVAPEPMRSWMPLPERMLDVHQSYGGEDTWMGPYFGTDLHGGLDINMPSNTPLSAPISFDEQFYFNTLKSGANNNRWRGIRDWGNGDKWFLETYHIVEPTYPEHTPMKQGTTYAYSGGVRAGYTSHTHFKFVVQQAHGEEQLLMDPWVLFWQIFKDNREREQALKAVIEPVAPGKTGEAVEFSSKGSRGGLWGAGELDIYWDFGDGSMSSEANPSHVFVKPGIYPVSLIVSDGADREVHTQHITIDGEDLSGRSMWLESKDARFSEKRASWKTRARGDAVTYPAQVTFEGYEKKKWTIDGSMFHPLELTVALGEALREAPGNEININVAYKHGEDWLQIGKEPGTKSWKLTLLPELEKLVTEHGFYEADVTVSRDGAINSPLVFRVRVDFPLSIPADHVIVGHDSKDGTRSDYYWLAPEFHRPWTAAYSGLFLISPGAREGEYVRFTPNLTAGEYRVSLYGKPYETEKILKMSGGFYVKVQHSEGTDKVWVEPSKNLEIGTFKFAEGRQGYIEVISDGAKGMILVDAVQFEKREGGGTLQIPNPKSK